MYFRTALWIGRPRAAKGFSIGAPKTVWCGWTIDREENPLAAVKSSRSKACEPIAIAGWGFGFEECEIIPNGMLAREKWESDGIKNQDFRAIVEDYVL